MQARIFAYLRITVGSEAQCMALLDALAAIIGHPH
jgi:histidinol-phosphate/aromatic aminotransferase/cobyric acid decarboxylase-like protein